MERRVPLIGLTTYTATIPWMEVTKRIAFTPTPYSDLVARAGGRPVLLPDTAAGPGGPSQGATEVIDALDALVVIGGIDVDPSLYGESRDPHTGVTDLVRDNSEIALLRAALAVDLPILAICRGHQLLNVACGGTLIQHLPDITGSDDHQIGGGRYNERTIEMVEGSKVASIFGHETVVSCSHHQVVDRLGDGLLPTAYAADHPQGINIIEAVEHEAATFCVGVQWHPEDRGDLRPFEALVEAVASKTARPR